MNLAGSVKATFQVLFVIFLRAHSARMWDATLRHIFREATGFPANADADACARAAGGFAVCLVQGAQERDRGGELPAGEFSKSMGMCREA